MNHVHGVSWRFCLPLVPNVISFDIMETPLSFPCRALSCRRRPSSCRPWKPWLFHTFPVFLVTFCEKCSEHTTFNTLLRKLLTCSLYATASCESERREGRESREGTLQFFTTQSKLGTDSVFARFQRCIVCIAQMDVISWRSLHMFSMLKTRMYF